MKKIIICIIVLIFASWGCEKDSMIDPVSSEQESTLVPGSAGNTQPSENTMPTNGVYLFDFQDIDGNVYHAIKIGAQIWSKENLKATHYSDGTPIPNVQGANQWIVLKSGAYCHYNNDASNSEIYGLLYNYYTVNSNKLAPKGWHVATYEDWIKLTVEIGTRPLPMIGDVGPLVDQKNWTGPFYSVHDAQITCTNSTLFTALPNGYRDNSISRYYPEFDCLGYQSSWWASNDKNAGIVIYLDQTFGIFSLDDRPGYVGSGIRLVKDAE